MRVRCAHAAARGLTCHASPCASNHVARGLGRHRKRRGNDDLSMTYTHTPLHTQRAPREPHRRARLERARPGREVGRRRTGDAVVLSFPFCFWTWVVVRMTRAVLRALCRALPRVKRGTPFTILPPCASPPASCCLLWLLASCLTRLQRTRSVRTDKIAGLLQHHLQQHDRPQSTGRQLQQQVLTQHTAQSGGSSAHTASHHHCSLSARTRASAPPAPRRRPSAAPPAPPPSTRGCAWPCSRPARGRPRPSPPPSAAPPCPPAAGA